MDQTSFGLLAHFDRPKTDNRVNQQAFSASKTTPSPIVAARRGVRWVFQWAAAVAVLAFAATILAEFSYQLVAERQLTLAARAGVVEATLPRANYQSIQDALYARLISYPR